MIPMKNSLDMSAMMTEMATHSNRYVTVVYNNNNNNNNNDNNNNNNTLYLPSFKNIYNGLTC